MYDTCVLPDLEDLRRRYVEDGFQMYLNQDRQPVLTKNDEEAIKKSTLFHVEYHEAILYEYRKALKNNKSEGIAAIFDDAAAKVNPYENMAKTVIGQAYMKAKYNTDNYLVIEDTLREHDRLPHRQDVIRALKDNDLDKFANHYHVPSREKDELEKVRQLFKLYQHCVESDATFQILRPLEKDHMTLTQLESN